MTSLFEAVQAFFVAKGWETKERDDGTLRMRYESGKNANWTCVPRVREEHGQVMFLSIMPGTVPPSMRSAIAEYIARANFGLVVGNFELDFGDGELRFRTSLDLGPDGHERAAFARLFDLAIKANLQSLDRHVPNLLDVVGGIEPADALAATLAEADNADDNDD